MTRKQFQYRANHICRIAGTEKIDISFVPANSAGLASLNDNDTDLVRVDIEANTCDESGAVEVQERFISIHEAVLDTVPAFRDYVLVTAIAIITAAENNPTIIVRHAGTEMPYNRSRQIRETQLFKFLGYTVERHKGLIVRLFRKSKCVWAANAGRERFKGKESFYVGPRDENGERLWPAFG